MLPTPEGNTQPVSPLNLIILVCIVYLVKRSLKESNAVRSCGTVALYGPLYIFFFFCGPNMVRKKNIYI